MDDTTHDVPMDAPTESPEVSGHEPAPSTTIIDDVFADAVATFKPRFEVNYEAYLDRLWDANQEMRRILQESTDLETARDAMYAALDRAERSVFDLDNDLHILEKATVREAVRVFKSILGPINEHRTGFSALRALWLLANGRHDELEQPVSVGFLKDFINLFRGVAGKANNRTRYVASPAGVEPAGMNPSPSAFESHLIS